METPTAVKAELSFKPEDFAADLAKLAAEQTPPATVATAQPEVKPTPEMPAQPSQAAVTPEPPATQAPAPVPQAVAVVVPDKFKGPDGQLDTAKLEKSTVNVDQALASYLAKEKELKRKINEVRTAENAYLNPVNAPVPVPSQAPANIPFYQQLEQDVQTVGLGKTLEKLFTASQEAALEQARKEVTPLRQGFEEATTRQQIEAIGKADPWVYTPEGVAALNQILTDQPYLMHAVDPYKAAYIFHQGQSGVRAVVERSGSQVLTPTPPAKATAPVPSAVAANMTPQTPTINLDNKEAIDAHLKTLTLAQQEEFFCKLGLPRFNAR